MIVVGVYVYNSSHFLLYCVSDELCGGVVCGVWCVVCKFGMIRKKSV